MHAFALLEFIWTFESLPFFFSLASSHQVVTSLRSMCFLAIDQIKPAHIIRFESNLSNVECQNIVKIYRSMMCRMYECLFTCMPYGFEIRVFFRKNDIKCYIWIFNHAILIDGYEFIMHWLLCWNMNTRKKLDV